MPTTRKNEYFAILSGANNKFVMPGNSSKSQIEARLFDDADHRPPRRIGRKLFSIGIL
jgi:hypothetical protein